MRHELSIEQMKYYQEITQAAVGRNEEIRKEALNSLAEDTGIHAMLPRFTNFISEGIKCNINENNLGKCSRVFLYHKLYVTFAG